MFLTLAGVAVLSFLIQVILSNILRPEGRGAYAVCIVFGTLLGLAFTPGAAQGTQYFVMARHISVSQGVSSAMIIGLIGGGSAVALAIPLIYSDISFFQRAETNTFLLTLLLIPLTVISVSLDHQLVAHRRFRRLAIFSMLRVVVNMLTILIFVWYQRLGVNGAVVSFAIGHFVMVVACLLDLRKHCGLAFEMPRRQNLTRILSYGFKFHIARIGNALEPQIGVVVLGLISSQTEIGLFSTASAFMLAFMLISNSIGKALLPRIAGTGHTELVALCLRLVSIFTAVPLITFLVLSTPLIGLLLSEAFLPVVPLLWIIAPGILAYAASGILMTHFKGTNLPAICSWAVFLGLCVNLCTLLLLYSKLDVEAAAWAMTAGMICRYLLLMVVYHRTTRVAWLSTWFPRTSDASFLRAASRSVFTRRPREIPTSS